VARPPSCPLPHVDETKVQVDVAVWSQMQRAVTDALTAQRDIGDKIATAVAAEREAARAARGHDVTGIQQGNQLLREQLAASNEDTRDRDRRILELLGRVDTLQQEVARLKGERADLTLADNREQRLLDLERAKLASSDERFRAVIGQVAPLMPLLARVSATAAKMAMGNAPAEAPADPVVSPARPPEAVGAAVNAEPEVIQAVAWTNARIDDWKAALCELVMVTSPQTASAFRFWFDSLGLFSAPPDAMPEMVRALLTEAGPELVQRLQTLTAAARPG
jgi:hypothetical protein